MAEDIRRDGGSPGTAERDVTSETEARSSYGRSPVREQTDRLKQRAREKGSELKETVQRGADDLKETAQIRAEEFKEQAERRTDELTSKIGARVSVLARALRRAGEELRTEGEARFADMTDSAAGQVERWGSYLDGSEPNVMLGDVEKMAKSNPALFLGSTFAIGMLVGRFLRAGDPGPDVVFEPEGEWGFEPGENGGPRGGGSMAGGNGADGMPGSMTGSIDDLGMAGSLDEAQPYRAMTPDMENISAEHPSEPAPDSHLNQETPARSAFPGHETRGPGVRTGSSGAAALDAGSGGPRQGENDNLRMRRREPGEGER